MLAKDFFYRNGFLELQLINRLLKSPSLVILMSMIMNNDILKEQAAKHSIDKTTLPKLQWVFETLYSKKGEFHFIPKGRKQNPALKKLEKDNTAILEPTLKYLKETLPSFAKIIEAMNTDRDQVVSDEAHADNAQRFKIFDIMVGNFHRFITNPRILQEDNEILVHANDLLKINTLLNEIKILGALTKGKYPFTAKKKLTLARIQRDNWLDKYPSIVLATLRPRFSTRGEKKRNHTEL